jgi:hypothetical protein
MMKKVTITLLLCVAWVLTVNAQNTVESIRKVYQDVHEWIAQMGTGLPSEYFDLHVVQNLPATGPHLEDVKMYWGERDDDEIYPSHFLRFATVKYNFAAREFYEEYLYDDDGKIAFIYARTPDADEDLSTLHDLRFYFSNGKLIRATVKSGPLDATELKDIYSGTTVPKQYDRIYQSLLASVKNYMNLFESIETTTHL